MLNFIFSWYVKRGFNNYTKNVLHVENRLTWAWNTIITTMTNEKRTYRDIICKTYDF